MDIQAVFEFRLPHGFPENRIEVLLQEAAQLLTSWAGHDVRLDHGHRAPERLRCPCGGTRFTRRWEDEAEIFRDEDGELIEESVSPAEPELICVRCGRRLEMPEDWK